MTTNRMTPADLELVDFSDVVLGDVLVNFTPTNGHAITPATQRQIDQLTWKSADPRRILTVAVISSPRTGILEFNTGPDRWTGMTTAKVWRVKH